MLLSRAPYICAPCRINLQRCVSLIRPRPFSTSSFSLLQTSPQNGSPRGNLGLTRNIGIIAHIDAGKTTTTERMLYYSGFTRRIGDVDDGSTVTDFLPAERARGITIQSAAITLHWPPLPSEQTESEPTMSPGTSLPSHTINLIDTPGHADFTFEVTRSLRILDGSITILDAVAGVEAQTEKVWHQASLHSIPRLVYVNKLDRDGASFAKTVRDIAERLHTVPVCVQIPWWHEGRFVGVGDAVGLRGLLWEGVGKGDGKDFEVLNLAALRERGGEDVEFATELVKARAALIEALTEQDDVLVEDFLESGEDWDGFPAEKLEACMRRVLLGGAQKVTPVYAGASFRNIGVQPLLDAVIKLLPSPEETVDPNVSIGGETIGLRKLLDPKTATAVIPAKQQSKGKMVTATKGTPSTALQNLTACALAFKVVSDPKRGVLVYIRVYAGTIPRNALLHNTSLHISERGPRLLRMYASEAVEVQSLSAGEIGVIAGLKHARTGDTLITYGSGAKTTSPPEPIASLALQPIHVPPPLFFVSVEPNSLAEEKSLQDAMGLLLREDPSLSVSVDAESGQTHLAGMGELHLEIARDRLIKDFKVKARMGKIEIGYREAIVGDSGVVTELFDREVAGKRASAQCAASVTPLDDKSNSPTPDDMQHDYNLTDGNILTIHHPTLDANGKPASEEDPRLPPPLPLSTILSSLRAGVSASLARGPSHAFPVHSAHVTITFDPTTSLTPSTTPAAITSAARQATTAALRAAAASTPAVLMEPVMRATIAVTEAALGAVVHDLSSARGGHVLSLDADSDADDGELDARLTPAQLGRVYMPPDPFGGTASGDMGMSGGEQGRNRQIRARVPLKEMVGYLKHLRSLTGGRGTFVMSVDRFERMGAQRMRVALAEMRGDFV